jgi:hypothetical protein
VAVDLFILPQENLPKKEEELAAENDQLAELSDRLAVFTHSLSRCGSE